MTRACTVKQTREGSKLNIGVHLSLGTKPGTSVAQAAGAGATCLQIFASSPGAWKAPLLHEDKTEQLRAAVAEHGMHPLVIHAIYLINLASPDPVLRRRSIQSLQAAMEAAAALGAMGVVTHLGSHSGRGFEAVAGTIASGLRQVIETAPDRVALILENNAGAGGLVGAQLEELAALIAFAGSSRRLLVALDTAHLCGAGWDLAADGEGERLVEAIRLTFGLDRLALIHANDSAAVCGSRRDRHAVVGEGHIGLAGFACLLAQGEIRRLPWILETPDLDPSRRDGEQWVSIRRLRALAADSSLASRPGSTPEAVPASTAPAPEDKLDTIDA